MKTARIISEVGSEMAQYFGKFSRNFVIVVLESVIRTIHENVFLDGVAVEVKIYAKLFFMSFFEMFSKAQQLKHLRKGEPSRLIEGAVEILAKQAGPVVSSDDTIRVEHGHYIKDIFAANLASRRVRTANKLNKPLSNVGRV